VSTDLAEHRVPTARAKFARLLLKKLKNQACLYKFGNIGHEKLLILASVVLRGVVYMKKSTGPTAEPWGHRRRMCTRKTGQFHI